MGVSRVILFNLCGHGHFDMQAYTDYFAGKLQDYEYPADKVDEALRSLPEQLSSPETMYSNHVVAGGHRKTVEGGESRWDRPRFVLMEPISDTFIPKSDRTHTSWKIAEVSAEIDARLFSFYVNDYRHVETISKCFELANPGRGLKTSCGAASGLSTATAVSLCNILNLGLVRTISSRLMLSQESFLH